MNRWHGKFHGGKGSRALTGEAVEGAEEEGAEDTESTLARRDLGGIKTVAGAGDAEAGEGEASAAAKAAAVLC